MKRTFTLIELLLVIVIIAVLVGVVLPSLGKARQCGWASACLKRQGQFVIAAYGYAQDSRDFVPREGFADGARLGHPIWCIVLRPYLDAQEPSGDGFRYAPYYLDPARKVNDAHAVHFVCNGMPFTGAGTVDPDGAAMHRRPATQLYRLQFPARVVYFSDFGDDDSGEVQALIDQWAGFGDEGIGEVYDLWAIRHLDPQRLGLRRHYGTSAVAARFEGSAATMPAKGIGDTGVWDDGIR